MGISFIESSDKQMAGELLVTNDVAEQLLKACFKHGSLLQKSGNIADLFVD